MAEAWLELTYGAERSVPQPRLGWRGAYLVLGVLAAVVGAGMALLIENDPHDRGVSPDGDPSGSAAPSARAADASVREAIGTWQFVSLYTACLICSFAAFVPFVHHVPYALDHGVPQPSAVLLLGGREEIRACAANLS